MPGQRPTESVAQSQRDCVLQPRVGRRGLPWVNRRTGFPTPTGLCPFRIAPPQSFQGCMCLPPCPSAEWNSAISQSETLRGVGNGRRLGPIRRSAEYHSAIRQIDNLYNPAPADTLNTYDACRCGKHILRVADSCVVLPRVARSSQPWALGRNPVGILFGTHSSVSSRSK